MTLQTPDLGVKVQISTFVTQWEYPLRPILAGGGNMPNMANLAYIVP